MFVLRARKTQVGSVYTIKPMRFFINEWYITVRTRLNQAWVRSVNGDNLLIRYCRQSGKIVFMR
jgi:hypothetical protein